MYSKAKIGTHPIHPMLVTFPIAFYTLAMVAFFVYQSSNQDIFWYKLAYFSNYAGVFTALLASVPGIIDWYAGIPKQTAAKRRGFLHMSLNVGALILFMFSAAKISGTWDTPLTNVALYCFTSLVGVALTMFAGFQGWELIATDKVGVNLTSAQERLEKADKIDSDNRRVDRSA